MPVMTSKAGVWIVLSDLLNLFYSLQVE